MTTDKLKIAIKELIEADVDEAISGVDLSYYINKKQIERWMDQIVKDLIAKTVSEHVEMQIIKAIKKFEPEIDYQIQRVVYEEVYKRMKNKSLDLTSLKDFSETILIEELEELSSLGEMPDVVYLTEEQNRKLVEAQPPYFLDDETGEKLINPVLDEAHKKVSTVKIYETGFGTVEINIK